MLLEEERDLSWFFSFGLLLTYAGFPKIGGTILGVPRIRNIVYWGLSWGPLILGNYHMGHHIGFSGFGDSDLGRGPYRVAGITWEVLRIMCASLAGRSPST